MDIHDELIEVEVVYATPDDQRLFTVKVPRGSTVRAAVEHSGILGSHPDLDIETCPLGIFGERVEPCATVSAGDRVEIYRPLIADPKESRRRRAIRRAAR